MGFEQYDNNRSTRLKKLIDQYHRLDYTDFKRIKFDKQFPNPFNYSWMNIDSLFLMRPSDYPRVKNILKSYGYYFVKLDTSNKKNDNNTVDLNDIWYESHRSIIERVAIDCEAGDRVEELFNRATKEIRGGVWNDSLDSNMDELDYYPGKIFVIWKSFVS